MDLDKAALDKAFEAYWETEGGTLKSVEAAIRAYLESIKSKEKEVKAVNNHEALVKALEFYADGRRYEGPNTHPIADDPYAPADLSYRYDTTRDLGRVARAALAAAKGEA